MKEYEQRVKEEFQPEVDEAKKKEMEELKDKIDNPQIKIKRTLRKKEGQEDSYFVQNQDVNPRKVGGEYLEFSKSYAQSHPKALQTPPEPTQPKQDRKQQSIGLVNL